MGLACRAALVLALILPRAPAGFSFSSLHLIIYCRENSHWLRVHQAASASINFTTNECMHDAQSFTEKMDSLIALASSERVGVVASIRGLPIEPFASALRAGVAVFFIEVEPDYAALNLSTADILSFTVRPDNTEGARFTGSEICRVKPQTDHSVVLVYGTDNDVRCDEAVQQFRRSCPDVSIEVRHRVRATGYRRDLARQEVTRILIAEPTITTIIAASDGMAFGALDAADHILAPNAAKRLIVSGFDNSPEAKPYLDSRRLLSSVDQSVYLQKSGLWRSFPQLLEVVQDQDLTSADNISQYFGLSGHILSTPVMGRSSDAPGFVTSILQSNYVPSVRATPQGGMGPVEVRLRISEFKVSDYLVSTNMFHATFVIDVSWHDERLMWEETQYGGALQWPVEDIWTPDITIENRQSTDQIIFQARATIDRTGAVTVRSKLQGQFHCTMNIRPYPFTVHTCGIRIKSYTRSEDVRLIVDGGFAVAGGPTDYHQPLEALRAAAIRGTVAGDYAVFDFRGVLKTDFVMNGYVLAAWLLNMISFAQLYVPHQDDRTGFAMATILAFIVLQMNAKQTKEMTWLEVFFMISLGFQVLSFLISVIARRSSEGWADKDADTNADLLSLAVKRSRNSDRRARLWVRVVKLMFGLGEFTFKEDRWSRRLMVPAYLVLTTALPFLPNWGGMDVSQHPESGLSCLLFQLSAAASVPFVLGAASVPFVVGAGSLQQAFAACRDSLSAPHPSSSSLPPSQDEEAPAGFMPALEQDKRFN